MVFGVTAILFGSIATFKSLSSGRPALLVGLVLLAVGALLVWFDWRGSEEVDKERAVNELLQIYDAHPAGFVLPRVALAHPEAVESQSPHQAARVRELGKLLNQSGGMPAMLDAHARFAARTLVPGAARNLEIMWDQIGEWRG